MEIEAGYFHRADFLSESFIVVGETAGVSLM